MTKIIQSNTPWLAALWLCCGTAAVVAQDESTQEEKQTGNVQEIIREVIKDAKNKGDMEVSIDVQSIMVQDNDKEGEKKVTGRVVIKDQDGKARVIDLGDALENGLHSIVQLDGDNFRILNSDDHKLDLKFDVQKNNSAFRFRSVTPGQALPTFRIGVQCEPVDAAIRAHVEVPDDALMVRDVIEDGPAAKAGLKQYDIIVQVGEKAVGSLEALVEQIQSSDGKELTFTVLRKGTQKVLAVTPKKRKASAVQQMILRSLSDEADGEGLQDLKLIIEADGMDDLMQFEALRPGILLDKSANMEKLMRRLPMIVNDLKDAGVSRRGKRSPRERSRAKRDADRGEKQPVSDDGDHDRDGQHEEDNDAEADDDDDNGHDSNRLQSRVRQLTKEIKRLESALKKLQTKRR